MKQMLRSLLSPLDGHGKDPTRRRWNGSEMCGMLCCMDVPECCSHHVLLALAIKKASCSPNKKKEFDRERGICEA